LGLALAIAVGSIAAVPGAAGADPPVVVIDAPEGIVDEPKRPATMRVFDSLRREDYSGHIGIEVRGYGSKNHPKISYALETRRASGADREVSLLGMAADEDWVLIANYKDESLLRNYVAYSTSRWLGRYAPRTRLVEVVVNDSYEGVYLLAEQLKVEDSRVAVDDSDVRGGYLLHMISPDRTPGELFFTTPVEHQPIVYKDPGRNEISYGRAAWIRKYVGRFERKLYGPEFRQRRRGYSRYLNVGAAVDYLLLNELFRNQATFRFSTHMYNGVGGKLVLGPIWDFDLAIGNSDAVEANQAAGWHYEAYPWAERLYADPGFGRRMAGRWQDLRARGIRRHIMRTIDSGAEQIGGDPQERNFSRWPTFDRRKIRHPRDPRTGKFPANHAQTVDYLKWWIRKRITWIDEQLDDRRQPMVGRSRQV
jgi:hypothetical protein